MLTTTLDGLWVLQVLSGMEVLAPELGLRPHLPRVETPVMALEHPVAGDLHTAGVIDASGAVDQLVLEWLTVLHRRDVSLLMHVQTPTGPTGIERIILARFAQWWVRLERSGAQIRLKGVGTATDERSAGVLINSQIAEVCGQLEPAELKPVTVDVGKLLADVKDRDSLHDFLVGQGLDAEQVGLLALAADRDRSALASIVALQSGVQSSPARTHVAEGAATIIDTPRGRLVSEHVERDARRWMILSPGSSTNIATAVLSTMRRLPSESGWHSHRKAV